MIHRFDKLALALPVPEAPNANAAAAVQELMGGKFGEMSTFMNYTFQSFNFRGREKIRPFYDLVANIAAEEYSHIELVAATINLLLTGTTARADRNQPIQEARVKSGGGKKAAPSSLIDPAPLAEAMNARNTHHFLASGQMAMPTDSMGRPWTGDNVVCTGNLKMDLLHNFFLECGARAGKVRVYEMVSDPTARAMVGFLLVRGGVHIVAYARALEKLTGANVSALLPIPDISNKKFPEAMKHEAQGLHRVMYRWSPEDYRELDKIWNGPHPEDGQELIIKDQIPEGAPWPDFEAEPQLASPLGDDDFDPDMMEWYSKALDK